MKCKFMRQNNKNFYHLNERDRVRQRSAIDILMNNIQKKD